MSDTQILPPGARSATAAGLTEAAQRGEFALQVCPSCGTVQPQRRLGGTIALALLVAGLVVAALAAVLV